jgi:NagD protein
MPGIVCDIDGVILRDNRPLPGAVDFTQRLLKEGSPFLFLTNFPSQTPGDLRNRFLGAGLDVPEIHFYTSAMATIEFLRDQAGEARRVYVIGEGALVHALYDAGFILSDNEADFVVLGETQSYHFDMIEKAAHLILGGARFIATNPDVAGPYGRPSCGALAAPIERITGRAPFYVGKPNAVMMRAALRHMKAHSEEAWMIGDNMETDIIAGIQTGMRTVLVLSGVSQETDLPRFAYRPHYVVAGVSEVLPLIESVTAS